jgi:WD40 repeat protein
MMVRIAKSLRVFISSPGDVSEERALAERVLGRLADEYRDTVRLEVVLWEHEPLFAHTGFQEQIERPSQCDLVVCVLWSRLGTRLPRDFARTPGEPPPTGTEFEIRDALDSFRRLGRPNLLIYRKTARPQVDLDSAEAEERLRQYRLLQAFCSQAFYDEQGAVLVAHHPYGDAWVFERELSEHVRKWLERQVGEGKAKPRWRLGSPYRGLGAFEAQHREIYFGRAQAISEVITRLRAQETTHDGRAPRFLLVQGMSGLGKSSLVQAGVLPLLEGRAVEGIGAWEHVILRPSESIAGLESHGAFGVLAERLAAALPELRDAYSSERLAERLRDSPGDTAARLDGYLTGAASRRGLTANQIRLLIFVNQLEECWTALGPIERARLSKCLSALSREGRIWVLATLRSDYVGRMEETLDFASLITEGVRYTLLPPRVDELAEMIRGPALAAGLEWETVDGVSLDQSILRDAGESPESLPLLEHALDQLYERREGRRLSYEAYERLGRLSGGIAASAEAVLTAHGESGARALPTLLRTLVCVDESGQATRRYAALEEFPEGSAERLLLSHLIESRLCISDRQSQSVASLAHEALLRSWPRLTDWLATERNLLQDRETVERDATLWNKHGRGSDWLATTADKLAVHSRLETSAVRLSDVGRAYVTASGARASRNRWFKRASIAALVILTIASSIVGAVAVRQRDSAQNSLARYFESKAWDRADQGNRASALRYAITAYDTSRPRGVGLQPLLARLAFEAPEGAILPIPASVFLEASFSPDSKRIVTSSGDNTARVWDTTSGDELARLAHEAKVNDAKFSPDGTRVLTASTDQTARIWDASTGREIARLGHNGMVGSVAFSRNGTRIVTVSANGAWIWDPDGGRELLRLSHDAQVNSAGFSPDGNRVVTASTDHTARIWDASTGQELLRLAHENGVSSAAFSSDGTRVVTMTEGTGRIWDASSGHEMGRPFQTGLLHAAYSQDATRIVTTSGDRSARVWDVATGRELARLAHQLQVNDAAFSSDGTRVVTASADHTARIWEVATGRELARFAHDESVRHCAFSPDGRLVVVVADSNLATIWRAPPVHELARLRHREAVVHGSFSRDGTRVVTASADQTARIWNTEDGRELARLLHDAAVVGAAFSPNGSRVVTASADSMARIWDARSGRELIRLSHEGLISNASFTDDGTRVVTWSIDNTAIVWDAASGRALAPLGYSNGVYDAMFSPDGEQLVTANADHTARVWNPVTGQELARFNHDDVVNAAAFSPDGTRVATASADRTARIWHVLSQRELARLKHEFRVGKVTFSADGKLIVTVSENTARIWDSEEGTELTRLQHDQFVTHAAFSPGGEHVVTASGDHSARIWDVASGRPIAKLEHGDLAWQGQFSGDGKRLVTASTDHTARIVDTTTMLQQPSELIVQLCRAADHYPTDFSAAEILADRIVAASPTAPSALRRTCGSRATARSD